jgi:hypothetical protein
MHTWYSSEFMHTIRTRQTLCTTAVQYCQLRCRNVTGMLTVSESVEAILNTTVYICFC